MNEDFVVFCPVVNRFDLLDVAAESTKPYKMIVLDNSDGLLGDRYKDTPHVSVYTPPLPLSFTSTSNLEYRMAHERGAKYYIHMHSDAQFPSEKIGHLLDVARQADADGRRWLVAFTLYDVLCVYNVAAMIDIGGYDSHLFSFYYSDNDTWRRAKLAGYERIEAGGEHVVHNGGGSVTINNDSRWKVCNDHSFQLSAIMFRMKWGGDPEKETFDAPFGRPDIFTDTKPVCP